ncbi:MAG: hypothetical protein H8D23_17640 [Candidatus Brocadiales bacterium]|nr:hypothetical protein [Candidatus Brocadiales bacterium]
MIGKTYVDDYGMGYVEDNREYRFECLDDFGDIICLKHAAVMIDADNGGFKIDWKQSIDGIGGMIDAFNATMRRGEEVEFIDDDMTAMIYLKIKNITWATGEPNVLIHSLQV